MWLPVSLNRPLVWTALVALPACIWIPDVALRMVAASMVALGLWDAWRQVGHQRLRLRLSQDAIGLANDAMVISDIENRVIAVNPAFTEITGYESHEILGLKLETLAAPRHDKTFYQHFWSTLKSTGRWEGEMWNRRKHGDEYPEWLKVRAITDKRGIRLVALLVPELHDLSSDGPYPPIYDKIGAALRKMGIDMINPLSRFQMAFSDDPSRAWAAPNDPHPNTTAHKVIADALYEYLAPRID